MDGAYILSEYGVREGVPSLILISTGTEVALAVGVAKVSVKQWKIVLTQIQGGDRKSVHRRELSSTNDYHDKLYLMQLAHTYHIKYYYISPSLLFLSSSLSYPLYFPLCLACPPFLSSPICILISISSSPLFCSVLLHSAIHYRKYRLQIMCTYVLYRCRAASSLTWSQLSIKWKYSQKVENWAIPLYHIILYYITSYYVIQHYMMLCHTVSYHITLCNMISHYIISCDVTSC